MTRSFPVLSSTPFCLQNSDCPGMLDMTTDGTFAGLAGWGVEVASNDANRIKNTAVLPPAIEKGGCN